MTQFKHLSYDHPDVGLSFLRQEGVQRGERREELFRATGGRQ
jgi:hypothetical protein